MSEQSQFKKRVEAMVAQIPKGSVMTYGQIAALCGNPRASRIVGGIAHWGNSELPWQRVVKKDGSLAEGYPGGISGHAQVLAAEGIKTTDNKVENIAEILWQPQ